MTEGSAPEAQSAQQLDGGTPAMLRKGQDLYRSAKDAGVTLRFIGSLAVQLTCPRHRSLAAALERRPSVDVDFVGYAREEQRTKQVFSQAGFELHPSVRYSQEYGVKRLIFVPPEGKPKIDVFLDDLIMAHTIPLAARLSMSDPTVTLVDLLLSKLQIHELTRNDLIDLVILLAEHEVGEHGIDSGYFGRVMGRDWGFSYSADINLAALDRSLAELGPMSPDVMTRVRARAADLRAIIADTPKSPKWKLRARIGPRLRWYEDVSEVE